MNAYTGGMANFSSPDQFAPRQQIESKKSSSSGDRIHLPTGGIRTAFHRHATASEPPPEKKQKVEVLPTPLSAMMAQASAPQSAASFHQQTNSTTAMSSTLQPTGNLPPDQSTSQSSVPTTTSSQPNTMPTFAKGGITLPKQQGQHHPQQQGQRQQPMALQIVNNPLLNQLHAAAFPANQQQVASHQQQLQQNFSAQQLFAAAATVAPVVTLPVGVGIRLGGVGGVAPAPSSGLQYKHTAPWSASSAADTESGGEVSDKTLAERRERNREHAKRSRVRKKFMLESLQEQVRGLQQENKNLRMLVQEHIPDKAVQIFAECCSQNVLFADDVGDEQKNNQDNMDRKDFALMQALSNGQQCFVLSDPKLPDNPIIFASPGFYKMTGYTDKEVLGRNCRFLQGQGTDPKSVDMIRKAIASGSDMTVCLLNYKADGTPFWNQFFIAALRDSDNNIVNFVRSNSYHINLVSLTTVVDFQVGVQTEVSPEKAVESNLEDKVNAVLPLQNSRDEKL